jgi:hypothetical protein
VGQLLLILFLPFIFSLLSRQSALCDEGSLFAFAVGPQPQIQLAHLKVAATKSKTRPGAGLNFRQGTASAVPKRIAAPRGFSR